MKIGIVTVLFKSDDVINGFIDSMNAQTFDNFHILFVENDVSNLHCERVIRADAEDAVHVRAQLRKHRRGRGQ
jgi:hypothetical protein